MPNLAAGSADRPSAHSTVQSLSATSLFCTTCKILLTKAKKNSLARLHSTSYASAGHAIVLLHDGLLQSPNFCWNARCLLAHKLNQAWLTHNALPACYYS